MVKMLHSYWAYLVLLILALVVINAILGYFGKRKFTDKDLRISLFGLIVTHIQLLVGVILYFVSPLFKIWSAGGMKTVMKDPYLRMMLVEHPMMNVLGVVLITIGWSLHKKQRTDQRKFGKIALFYTLGLIFILSRIPWDVWL